jgi:hypothetical protein
MPALLKSLQNETATIATIQTLSFLKLDCSRELSEASANLPVTNFGCQKFSVARLASSRFLPTFYGHPD